MGIKSEGCARIGSSEDKRAQSADIIGFKSQISPWSWLLGGSPVPHDPAGAGSCPRCLWGAARSRCMLTSTCGFRGALRKGRCRERFAGMFILRCFPAQVPTEEGWDAEERGPSTAGAMSPLLGHLNQGILQALPSSLHNIWDWPHLATWFHLSQTE